jgi:EAL domain-containing protein (putative c-di-GMP-specific phosphodiesterase class I)
MGELVLYYQPQFEIRTMRLVCAEALVRWRHPEQGFLTPDRFLAQAEETGFIAEIDEWTLKTVCGLIGSWLDSNLPPVCVTVNISARRFEKTDLVDRIAEVLKETGVDPDCLDLEVTESIAMSDVERTASQLRELRRMGVHVSIDDFGTGYSSLNYLKKLPIERIKIDKSFVQDIANSADDRAIISAVTSMARKMGIRTVAEGVETEEQLAFLRSAECDEAQGFLFSRPLSADQFRELITAR